MDNQAPRPYEYKKGVFTGQKLKQLLHTDFRSTYTRPKRHNLILGG